LEGVVVDAEVTGGGEGVAGMRVWAIVVGVICLRLLRAFLV
jgi:hypothetical protein